MPTTNRKSARSRIEYRELTTGDWPVVVSLFGRQGACGGCWCMWWRVARGGKLWDDTKGAKARLQSKRLIESGRMHAVLAFDGEEPVGWCTFGPREDFPRLETVKAYVPPDDASVSVGRMSNRAEWRLLRLCLAVAAPERSAWGRVDLSSILLRAMNVEHRERPVPFNWGGLRIERCSTQSVPASNILYEG